MDLIPVCLASTTMTWNTPLINLIKYKKFFIFLPKLLLMAYYFNSKAAEDDDNIKNNNLIGVGMQFFFFFQSDNFLLSFLFLLGRELGSFEVDIFPIEVVLGFFFFLGLESGLCKIDCVCSRFVVLRFNWHIHIC